MADNDKPQPIIKANFVDVNEKASKSTGLAGKFLDYKNKNFYINNYFFKL